MFPAAVKQRKWNQETIVTIGLWVPVNLCTPLADTDLLVVGKWQRTKVTNRQKTIYRQWRTNENTPTTLFFLHIMTRLKLKHLRTALFSLSFFEDCNKHRTIDFD